MTVIIGDNLANTRDGSTGADAINGLANRDVLSGLAGNDRIFGGEGADRILGGSGNDALMGFNGSEAVDGADTIAAKRIVTGLDKPVFACSAPDDPNRLFVVEQHTGAIRILDPATGAIAGKAFLDIPQNEITRDSEQGLLGLAFDPDYAKNGRFYVYVTNAEGNIEVRRYLRSDANPNVADPNSGDVILTFKHPFSNHNGGWMGFGPDGMLYISVGDGGSGGDPFNNAQNKNVLLGKMLRIDVSHDGFANDLDKDYAIPAGNPFAGANVAGADEIWALGLRNPWRPSFDRLTGDFYIADVGQDRIEEIDFQSASSHGGENYGWKVKEGDLVFDGSIAGNPSPNNPALVDPVFTYPHEAAPAGGFVVTGGYVYRGTSPGMQGLYFFADFATDQLWSFRIVNGRAIDVVNRTEQFHVTAGTLDSISSFAEDGHGNLYALGLDGEAFRINPGAAAGDGVDTIDGGAGRDTIFGGAGDDLLTGGSGNDRMFGGEAGDLIEGNQGNDLLTGGIGEDTLSGGLGNDRLTGGLGADFFQFAKGFGRDIVVGFEDNIDTLQLSPNLGIQTASEALSHATESGGNVIFNFGPGTSLTVLAASKAALADDIAVIG